jgi:hypothetical protein
MTHVTSRACAPPGWQELFAELPANLEQIDETVDEGAYGV